MEQYILIRWPESQELMDEPWFDEEAVLANDERFGSSAYFIPLIRYEQSSPSEIREEEQE